MLRVSLSMLFLLTLTAWTSPSPAASPDAEIQPFEEFPDLVPEQLACSSSTVWPALSVEITWSAKNKGSASAEGGWYDAVYLSADAVLDGGDVEIGGIWIDESLVAGASYTRAQQLEIPTLPPGTYFLILKTNAWESLAESDYANDSRSISLGLVVPNLVVSELTAPSAASTQHTVNVSWKVTNAGTGETGPWGWYDTIRLSSDNVLDDGDLEIGGFWVGQQLSAGASYTQTQQVEIPQVPAGTYSLILKTDVYDQVYENNEADNHRTISISVNAPNLVVSELKAPSSATTQHIVDVSWQVTNSGTGDAGSSGWYDTIRISSDNVLDDDDLEIGEFSVGQQLAAGATYTQTQQVETPRVPAGNYFLIVKTDVYEQIYESNEADNGRAVPITVTAPNLVASELIVPPAASTQLPVEISWKVTNSGTGNAGPSGWYDSIRISTDNVLDDGDPEIVGFSVAQDLAAGATYTQTQQVEIPRVPAGNYFLILKTDIYEQIYETNEADNSRAVPITVTTPNLVASELIVPPSASTQLPVEISWKVTNSGTGNAGPSGWYDSIRISTDNVLDGGDPEIVGFSVAQDLAAGATYTQTQQVEIPRVPAGNYFLIVKTDIYEQIYETDEADNSRAVPISITAPNLVASEVTAPSAASTQHIVDVSWKVTNAGTGEAGPSGWYDFIYFSTDNVFDTGDPEIGMFRIDQSLAAGAAYTQTRQVEIPQVPAGSYFLILRTDIYEQIYESNEADNSKTFAISVTVPNLVGSELTAPSTASTQHTVDVTWKTSNSGTGETGPSGWYDALYLSSDNALDEGDLHLGDVWDKQPLAPGASRARTLQVQIPEVPAGSYFLILKEDLYDQIYESNEADNHSTTAISVGVPDLVLSALSAPSPSSTQSTIDVSWTVKNTGTGEAGPSRWYDEIYLSGDGIWDDSDIPIAGQWHETALPSGKEYTQNLQVEVPSVTPGDYHLIVRTSVYANIYESSSANNVRSLPLTISAPDLKAAEILTVASASPLAGVEVTWTTGNVGSGTSPRGWADQVYLSQDAIFDSSDTLIETFWGPLPLAPGETYHERKIIQLPDIEPGDWFLILHVDGYGQVYEEKEDNNDLARAIHIARPEIVNEPEESVQIDQENPQSIGNVHFSPDGVKLAAASGQRVYLLSLSSKEAARPFTGHTRTVQSVDFSPVGDQVLSGASDGTARIWDSATRAQTMSFPSVLGSPNPAAFSSDGSRVLAGNGMSVARLWDALSGEELMIFTGHGGNINSVALSPDGSRALTGSDDKTAILWDVSTGNPLFVLSSHTSGVTSVSFSPDGARMLTTSYDGTIRLWDTGTGELVTTFVQGDGIPLNAAGFSPDGKYVVSAGGWPSTARLWEVASGLAVREFTMGEEDWTSINGVAVSPDQSLVASGHSDGTVRLWNSGLQTIALHPVTPLPLGGSHPLTLRSHGLYYFEVEVAKAQNILITLDPSAPVSSLSTNAGASPSIGGLRIANITPDLPRAMTGSVAMDPDAVRIAVTKGSIPSTYDYEFFGQSPVTGLHLEVPIHVSSPGKYYVLVFSPYLASGALETVLQAGTADFHLSGVSPRQAGTGGHFTAEITGTGLDSGTIARLISPDGQAITALETLSTDETILHATFDLTGAGTGVYSMEIQRPSDGALGSLAGAVTVSPGTGQALRVTLDGPTSLRPERTYNHKVTFQNAGNVDVPAPFISVVSSVPGALRYDENDTPKDRLLWLAANGSPGNVIPPDKSGTLPFLVSAGQSLNLSVETLVEDDVLFDWDEVEAELRPEGMPDEVWNPFWAKAKAGVGSTRREVFSTLRALNRARATSGTYNDLLRYALFLAAQDTPVPLRDRLNMDQQGGTQGPMTAYSPVGDVKVTPAKGTTFDPSKPTIVITHGWHGTEGEVRFNELARQAAAAYPNKNVVLVTWQNGANHLTPWGASSNIPAVGEEALRQLRENFNYSKWKDTIYIGESFGNGVNSYMSSHAPEKGYGLVLNDANPIGYIGTRHSIRDSFYDSIAIQTYSVGDANYKVGHHTIFHTPLCGMMACSPLSESHTYHIEWLAKLFTEDPTFAKSLIEGTLHLPNNGIFWDGYLSWDNRLVTNPLLYSMYNIIDFRIGQFRYLLNKMQELIVVVSIDPNDKIGPPGVGDTHVVSVQQTMNYVVNFENMASASAPVQELVVVDYLDSNLDWTTLRLFDVAYGDRVVKIPEGAIEYKVRDFPSPPSITGTTTGDMAIDVLVSFNPQTGRIEWRLSAIDTATGSPPEDALAGFLPPEDGTGRGQGRVTFSVKPRTSLSVGSVVTNMASIVFDTNEPILTNQVLNTIGSPTDIDDDGLLDAWELDYFHDLSHNGAEDSDGDNMTDYEEYCLGTNPASLDTDEDGIPDGWEFDHGLLPTENDASSDLDGDGYSNRSEYQHGTDPADPDSVPLPIVKYGQTAVDGNWKSLKTGCTAMNPVVIMGPPTSRSIPPGVVRVRNVGADSFDLRFQEWSYLDDIHIKEVASYLVLERGRYQTSGRGVWEVGTLDLDGNGKWISKTFDEPFPGDPLVFLTVQTTNESDPVVVRARNVTRTSFEAALFEEEIKTDGHMPESVGYLAIYKGTGSGVVALNKGSSPYLLQVVSLTNKFSPVLSSRLRLEEEKSADLEMRHVDEPVSVLALGSTLFAQVSGFNESDTVALRRIAPSSKRNLEWGMVNGITRAWTKVPLAKKYNNPVIVAKPVSARSFEPGVVELRNVNRRSFEVRFSEWTYLDNKHPREDVFYIVAEEGAQTLDGLTVQAGTLTWESLLSEGWAQVSFTEPFDSPPAVFAAVQTTHSTDPVLTRLRDVEEDQFRLTMDEEEGKRDGHPAETLGWIAMTKGAFTTSDNRSIFVSDNLLSNKTKTIPFDRVFKMRFPVVIADVMSTLEDEPCGVRFLNIGPSSVQLFLQEEKSLDQDQKHIEETISVFVAD